MMFPVWFFKFMVIGGTVLCSIGVVVLIGFLIWDMKDKQIW